jgi:phosphotransferase system HPr-like phosphotransfer protein
MESYTLPTILVGTHTATAHQALAHVSRTVASQRDSLDIIEGHKVTILAYGETQDEAYGRLTIRINEWIERSRDLPLIGEPSLDHIEGS